MTVDLWTRVLSSESSKLSNFFTTGNVRLVTSDLSSCMNSIDLFGRALSIDNAYRHMNAAEQYLLDASKMQDSAPHTNAAESAIDDIDHGKDWLRDYAVSPDTATCRDPPVCQTVPRMAAAAKASSMSIDVVWIARDGLKRNSKSPFF